MIPDEVLNWTEIWCSWLLRNTANSCKHCETPSCEFCQLQNVQQFSWSKLPTSVKNYSNTALGVWGGVLQKDIFFWSLWLTKTSMKTVSQKRGEKGRVTGNNKSTECRNMMAVLHFFSMCRNGET